MRFVRRRFLGAAASVFAATPGARAAARELRIGVQKYGTLVILRERRTLEPALAKSGWRVLWTEFPGGPQLLEALAAGALDFGITGEAPPVFAQAAGASLLYVGAEPPAPAGEAILVRPDSPVRGLAQLRGKRIAFNRGSNVHYLLVQALKSVGLTPRDVSPAYLAPADARAAFEEGAVDAWAIWNPFYAAAQAATRARVLTDATGLAPNRQFFLASRSFAGQQPALLKLVLEQIAATDSWAERHRAEAAVILAPHLGLSLAVVRTALDRLAYGVGQMTAVAVADQQRIADTFCALDLIPDPVSVRRALWSS